VNASRKLIFLLVGSSLFMALVIGSAALAASSATIAFLDASPHPQYQASGAGLVDEGFGCDMVTMLIADATGGITDIDTFCIDTTSGTGTDYTDWGSFWNGYVPVLAPITYTLFDTSAGDACDEGRTRRRAGLTSNAARCRLWTRRSTIQSRCRPARLVRLAVAARRPSLARPAASSLSRPARWSAICRSRRKSTGRPATCRPVASSTPARISSSGRIRPRLTTRSCSPASSSGCRKPACSRAICRAERRPAADADCELAAAKGSFEQQKQPESSGGRAGRSALAAFLALTTPAPPGMICGDERRYLSSSASRTRAETPPGCFRNRA